MNIYDAARLCSDTISVGRSLPNSRQYNMIVHNINAAGWVKRLPTHLGLYRFLQ